MPTTIGKEEEEEDEAALSLISPVAESGLGLGLGSKDNGSFSSPLLSLYLPLRLIFMKTGEIGMLERERESSNAEEH